MYRDQAMYRQRDVERHTAMTVDPQGSGLSSAIAAGARTDVVSSDGAPAPPLATHSRKRGRDIRGLDHFRSVVYNEKGFPRLHAMVSRSTDLMYPPDGIAEARQRLQQVPADAASLGSNAALDNSSTPPQNNNGNPDANDDEFFASFENSRGAEQAGNELANTTAAAKPPPSNEQRVQAKDRQLAMYHHHQLDVFLRLVYEFNHTAFVKLPMEDTLQLLSRCGKEAVAHVVEYEMHQRLQREARLKELRTLHDEREALQRRAMEAEGLQQQHLLLSAERQQALLEQEECLESQEEPNLVIHDTEALDETAEEKKTTEGNEEELL